MMSHPLELTKRTAPGKALIGSKFLEDMKTLHLIFFGFYPETLAVPSKSQGRQKQERVLLGWLLFSGCWISDQGLA